MGTCCNRAATRVTTIPSALFALSGTSAFWAIMAAAGFALLVILLLWNGRASEFFRTN